MQGRNDARAHGCCFWHRNHQLPNSQINLCLKITWFAVLLGIYTVSSFLLTSVKECIEYYLTRRLCEMKCNSLLIYVTLSLGLHSSIQWMKKRRFIFRYWLRFHLTWIIWNINLKIKTHAKYELFVDVLLEKMFIAHDQQFLMYDILLLLE